MHSIIISDDWKWSLIDVISFFFFNFNFLVILQRLFQNVFFYLYFAPVSKHKKIIIIQQTLIIIIWLLFK